jgi:wobble nucleotide-excising tRNase
MIAKIVAVKNVGRLKSLRVGSDRWDGRLKQVALIYAENGVGKTTLAAVLKSMSTQDPATVMGRQTLGAAQEPIVKILTEPGGLCEFAADSWTGASCGMALFDAEFIARNVHAGTHVSTEHKQNLCLFALGEDAVDLAERVDVIDEEAKTLTTKLHDIKVRIEKRIVGNMNIEPFLALQENEGVQAEIENQEAEILRLKRADELQRAPALDPVGPPQLDKDNLKEFLGATLSEMAPDVVARIGAHIAGVLDEDGENWLEYGVSRMHKAACPFCGQDVSTCALARDLQGYFGQTYRAYKTRLEARATAIRDPISRERNDALLSSLRTNTERWSSWKAHIDTNLAPPPTDGLVDRVKAAATCIETAIAKKLQAPLTPIADDEKVESCVGELAACSEFVAAYNLSVTAANSAIESVKKRASSGDLEAEQAKLDRLKNQQTRHLPDVTALCDEYAGADAAMIELKSEKEAKKKALQRATDAFSKSFESDVNGLLRKLGAEFEIRRASRELVNFRGRKANLDYCLVIRNVQVPLGGADTPTRSPSFRNTLSEGDKGTLAFALFVARQIKDDSIGKRILVLDDPINSFDADRKESTAHIIKDLARRAAQVLVLTHDMDFAARTYEAVPNLQTLQLRRLGPDDVEFVDWDINLATAQTYFRHYLDLAEFLRGGASELCDVAWKLRLVLEGNLRMRFPEQFFGDKRCWLGPMVQAVRDAAPEDPLHAVENRLATLEQLLTYSKRFHHETGTTNAGTPTRGELATHVRMALEFCGS